MPSTLDIRDLIVYDGKNDISYVEYNRQELPYMFNSTYIYHNNQNYNDGSYSQQLKTISNNLIIESVNSNIVMSTIVNKKVIVSNSMSVNNNLDVSNILTTNILNVNDISLGGVLYLNKSNGINIIGNVNIQGGLNLTSTTEKAEGFSGRRSYFITSTFHDGDISNSRIYISSIYDSTIRSSYIYNSAIGYDNNNNIARSKAIFTDVSLQSLTFDGTSNNQNYIKFPNNSNTSDPIIIKSSYDYNKLTINRPLIIGATNISNVSIFNGDISCNTLYYSHLVPDIRLNNYFDVSIGAVSVSGNIIPNISIKFDIGSSDYSFNNIYSKRFIGDLSGACSIANNLVKNLDMSFNNLDISGVFRISGANLNETLRTNFQTISGSSSLFDDISGKIRDLSNNVYTRNFVDICLNTNYIRRSVFELSFQEISGRIIDICRNVYTRQFVDLCLNSNYVKISSSNSSQFRIFNRFIFESSGNYIQEINSPYNSSIISEWRTNWQSPNNPVIRFHSNGDITNLNNSYGSWSDIRLKENIVNTGPKLQDLLRVRVVNYNLKGLTNTNKHIGVIAQELEEVFPGLVTTQQPSIEDINAGKTESYKSVKYSCFTSILIKALQEEQEIINKLDSRILILNEEYNTYKHLHDHAIILKNDISSLKQENIVLKSKLNEILSELGKNIIP